ncbi:uncharacterized protein PAS_chr1-3_0308 [Komagataella phaffii GS115]|uniref:Uncharacterized protein n=1 Tax=Komagataella phaffii (strain GS115 / ATCC 20864) TaxID=644223 RepID=C4QVN5_KOMPG|nr:uncharacterized protein PAS_chr1-3_0308 [Komagataella phaffii GS115]AOA66096.1 GQ68_02738T0 [Komagataella phaffii GS115]CAY67308.1 hypothetical protein PAS_chr1-3_0308 [Komagataella phaffii GS115]
MYPFQTILIGLSETGRQKSNDRNFDAWIGKKRVVCVFFLIGIIQGSPVVILDSQFKVCEAALSQIFRIGTLFRRLWAISCNNSQIRESFLVFQKVNSPDCH